MPRPKTTDLQIPDPLLTPTQVAERLNVSRRVLYHWRDRGGGPPSFRVGAAVRYRTSAVEGWLAAQEQAEQVRR